MLKKFKIIILVTAALALVLAMTFPASAHEVVVLKSADIKPYNDALEGFRNSCNCTVREISLSETDPDEALARLHRSGASAVFAIGVDALNLTKAVRDIPVVYAMVPHSQSASPVQKASSGVNMYIPPARFLSSMQEVFRGVRRIGVIYDPKNSDLFIRDAVQAAEDRGIELVLKKTSRAADIPALVDEMEDRIDVFWMIPDKTVLNPETIKYLLLFSFKNKVPVFTFTRKYVEMGCVAGLYADPRDMGVQAGEIAHRLLSEKNGTISVDSRKTVLVINRKIARKIGIRIRDDVLGRAEYAD